MPQENSSGSAKGPAGSPGGRRVARDEWLRYQMWRLRRLPSGDDLYRQHAAALRLPYTPLVSIVTPLFETPPDALRRMLDSVRHQTYPGWQHCLVDDGSSEAWIARRVERAAARDSRILFRRRPTNRGIVAASNDALGLATGEFVAFLDHDDILDPEALYRVVEELNRRPDADVIYSDLDTIDRKGVRIQPCFFPDWSPELLLSAPYVVHLTAYRRKLLEEVGGLRPGLDGAQDYDLALRLSERTARIAHLPRILYHWCMSPTSAAGNIDAKPYADAARTRALVDHLDRTGIVADVREGPAPGYHSVRFAIAGRPRVSLIVRIEDGSADVVTGGPSSLISQAGGVECDLTLVGAPDLLQAIGERLTNGTRGEVRLVPTAVPGDAAVAWNLGGGGARGDHLVFLDRPLEAVSAGWLSAMLEFSQQRAIGAVGPKIYAPDGAIEDAGVVIPKGAPHGVLRGTPGTAAGYMGNLRIPMNYLAVSGACLMTRRAVFEKASGFRATDAVGFPDIDYCLRLRDLGYRVVFTPHAELRRPGPGPKAPVASDPDRLRIFRACWSGRPPVDPYYNPNFCQDDGSFALRAD